MKKVRPKDKDAVQKFEECSKIVKWMAFQKAISVDTNHISIAESIKLDTIGMCSVCRSLIVTTFLPTVHFSTIHLLTCQKLQYRLI